MPTILIVDNNEEDLQVLELMLVKLGYDVEMSRDFADALDKVMQRPFDMVMVSDSLESDGGYELCKEIKNIPYKASTPVIFLCRPEDNYDVVHGFELGAADYVLKPYNAPELKVRVSTHLKLGALQKELYQQKNNLEKKIQKQVQVIQDTQMATIFSLAKLAQSRDDETGLHLERIQRFCYILAEDLSRNSEYSSLIDDNFLKNILHASPLHDIGKVGIPDKILLKPGKLTDDEFEVMKTHTLIGAETLEMVNDKFGSNEFIDMGIDIARSHHERWDGSGYPSRLKGEEIPISARIMAVADVYDALRAKRVYKSSYSQEKTCTIIIEGKGSQFDPVIVSAFIRVADKFDKVFREWFD